MHYLLVISGSYQRYPKREYKTFERHSVERYNISVHVYSGTEALIAQLRKYDIKGRIQGIRISCASPRVSHLLFAYDSLLFCKAYVQHSKKVIDIIRPYCEASGQEINFSKSSIMFGQKFLPP